MTIEVRIEEDIVTKNIMIVDCTGANISHVMKLTPVLLKKCDACLVSNYDLAIVISNRKIMNIFLN